MKRIKPINKEPLSSALSLHITDSRMKDIEEECERVGVTQSELIRLIFDMYFEQEVEDVI